jgi:hypothetical protein
MYLMGAEMSAKNGEKKEKKNPKNLVIQITRQKCPCNVCEI